MDDRYLQLEFQIQRANGTSMEDALDFILMVKQQKEAHGRAQPVLFPAIANLDIPTGGRAVSAPRHRPASTLLPRTGS